MKYSTLFLDRDGVINRRLPGQYISNPESFEFLPTVIQALKQLRKKFDYLIIITNQQGVGKELMTWEQLETVHEYMKQELLKSNVKIDAIYTCTELAGQDYNCRKPNPIMGLQAKRDFPKIDFSASFMVGDSVSDIEFGQGLGMLTALIPDKEEEADLYKDIKPDYRVKDLLEFAGKIK